MTTSLFTNYRDSLGNLCTLEGCNVQEIAEQLDENDRVELRVRDEAGFTRGWIYGRNEWRAQ